MIIDVINPDFTNERLDQSLLILKEDIAIDLLDQGDERYDVYPIPYRR